MGQVWQATDTQLNRQVALKILPDAFAEDPDRLARFTREAQILASLNHPNIAQIHGIEEAEGTRALVLELVDGPTLADRIAKGPIPLDEALPIAKQIAEALEAAHEAGVIHRDLKPANIKVREDGTVKVLDFGLAKALDPNPEGDPSQSPTLTAAATQMGVIMGTAAYMSPEQAKGKTVGRQADVWAFGAVLYEMLTGKRAFSGDGVSDTLAAVLRAEVDFEALPADTPRLRHVVQACLERDPKQRVHDVADVRLAMEGVFETTVGAPAASVERAARPVWHWLVPPIVVGVLALALGMALSPDGGASAGSSAPAHFGLALPGVDLQNVRVSPDGRSLALVGRAEDAPGNQTTVWIRRIGDARPVALPDVEGFTGRMAWSPDGTELALGTSRGVVAVGIEGGLRRSLSAERFPFVSWGAGNTLLGGGISGLSSLDVGTGEIRKLADGLGLSPRFLPDGRRFLFTGLSAPEAVGNPTGVYLSSIDAPTERELALLVVSYAVYADGYVLFVRDGTLFAQPFDQAAGAASGQATPIVDGVEFFQPSGLARFDVAGNTLVYLTPPPDQTPTWVDRRGEFIGLLGTPGLYESVAIAPDGQRVVLNRVDRRQGTGDLWVHDLARNTETRLTNDEWSEIGPIWSRDGRRVAFGWDGDGPPDVYVKEADSDAQATLVYQTPGVDFPSAWLPDGRLLVGSRQGVSAIVDLDGIVDEDAADLPQGRAAGGGLSADGQWLAFTDNDTGRPEVYVQPFRRRGGRVRVSTGGGRQPRWSRDGRSLYYAWEQSLYTASVRVSPTFEHDTPRLLFSSDRQINAYDVLPDGEQVVLVLDASSDFQRVQVLLNWQARLP